jgi:hypothetical protein
VYEAVLDLVEQIFDVGQLKDALIDDLVEGFEVRLSFLL